MKFRQAKDPTLLSSKNRIPSLTFGSQKNTGTQANSRICLNFKELSRSIVGLDCARKTRLIQTAVKSAYFSPDRKVGTLKKLNFAIIFAVPENVQFFRNLNI